MTMQTEAGKKWDEIEDTIKEAPYAALTVRTRAARVQVYNVYMHTYTFETIHKQQPH